MSCGCAVFLGYFDYRKFQSNLFDRYPLEGDNRVA